MCSFNALSTPSKQKGLSDFSYVGVVAIKRIFNIKKYWLSNIKFNNLLYILHDVLTSSFNLEI